MTQHPSQDHAPAGEQTPPGLERARLGTTLSGQVRHTVETLIGRAAVERGMATKEQVVAAFEELKRLPPEMRAARFTEVFVRRGILTAEQIDTLREWVKDDAIGGGGPGPEGSSMVAQAGVPTGTAPAPAPGKNDFIPGYRFKRKLGQGAMGMVILAEQQSLDRLVAIKLVAPKYASEQAYIERFLKEKTLSAMLNDPNIVAAYEFGKAPNGMLFMVMEYMDSGSVHDIIEAKRRIPEQEAIRIARQAACALRHAHAKGLVHRDVKPKNLMLNASGAVKLADLGLAREGNDAAAADAEKGKVFGTPYYISPEQVRAGALTPATDIYGLGATLYHMVTGRLPFEGANPKEVMQKHLKAPLVPPDQIVRELSGGISMVIEMMMAKDPRERYRSAGDLIEDLDLVARGEPPVHARPKFDAPGAGLEQLEGPGDEQLVMASAPTAPSPFTTPLGIAMLALLGLSVAANAVMVLLLLKK